MGEKSRIATFASGFFIGMGSVFLILTVMLWYMVASTSDYYNFVVNDLKYIVSFGLGFAPAFLLIGGVLAYLGKLKSNRKIGEEAGVPAKL